MDRSVFHIVTSSRISVPNILSNDCIVAADWVATPRSNLLLEPFKTRLRSASASAVDDDTADCKVFTTFMLYFRDGNDESEEHT